MNPITTSEQRVRAERFGQAGRMLTIGTAATCVLMTAKLLAGRFGRSEAVFADGIESACDLAVALATWVALRISRRPYDTNHPYGHGRVESLTALCVGFVILATGIWILITAIDTLRAGGHPRPAWIAAVAAAVTVAVKGALARTTSRCGRRLGSPLLTALATDHRKDALTSIGTLVGVTLAILGLPLLDPIAAGLTALLILGTGYRTVESTFRDLMDVALPTDLLESIAQVARTTPGVEHVHEIRGRRSGQFAIIDLKLDMDPEMTVAQSHTIATTVKRRIFAHCPSVGDVMIHVNPHDDPNHEDLVRL